MNVLLGTLDHVLPFLPEGAALPPAGAPSISVCHLPGDATTPLLVLTGPDEAAWVTPAAAFSVPEIPLPAAAVAVASLPENYPAKRTSVVDSRGKRGVTGFLAAALAGDPADGSGLRVQLVDGDPRTVLATWDFLGQTARRLRRSFPAMRASFNAPTDGATRLLVGLLPQWPASLQSRLPLRPAPEGRVAYASEGPGAKRSAEASRAFLDRLGEELSGRTAPDTGSDNRTSLAWRVPKEAFTGTALMLAEKESPTDRPTLVLTAADAGLLRDGVARLRQVPESRFEGSEKLLLWSPSGLSSQDGPAEEAAWETAVSPSSGARGFFSGTTLFVAGLVLAAIIVLALIAGLLLRRSGQRDEPEGNGSHETPGCRPPDSSAQACGPASRSPPEPPPFRPPPARCGCGANARSTAISSPGSSRREAASWTPATVSSATRKGRGTACFSRRLSMTRRPSTGCGNGRANS